MVLTINVACGLPLSLQNSKVSLRQLLTAKTLLIMTSNRKAVRSHSTNNIINLAMKLTALLLLSVCLAASATGKTQTITLSVRNAQLKDVFKEIKRQSGYTFMYTESLLQDAKKVSLDVKDIPLEEALKLCFAEQPFNYSIIEKTIVIKPMHSTTAVFQPAELPTINPPIPITVSGRLTSETGEPVTASIIVRGTQNGTTSSADGYFTLTKVDEKATLLITGVSIEPREVKVNGRTEINITVKIKTTTGEDVTVEVNTGYQKIPKERATGAFTQIHNETIERSRGVNLLDRLEGLASGFLLNRNLTSLANNPKYSIRGRSTIFANADPLIVVDGFPYDGTIEQINPADVESITMLKDAAAASIWGTRAGNGVIVVTTKSGRKNQKLSVGISSTITTTSKPDLFYQERLSSADYIDIESSLYSRGFYTSTLNKTYSPISQAVDIFNQRKLNQINAADSASMINSLKGYDIRQQLEEYAYRPGVFQQYALNVSGGSDNSRFYLSAGYDKNLLNYVADKYDRVTLNSKTDITVLKDRLDLSAGLSFSSNTTNSNSNNYVPLAPYDRIGDDAGNSLPVATTQTLRVSYADTAGGGRLLDWQYRPKDELFANTKLQRTQYRFNLGAQFKVINGLVFKPSFQYLRESLALDRDNTIESFFTRNKINELTSISGNTVNRIISVGSIFDVNRATVISKTIRLQLNYDKTMGDYHRVNAVAGYEGADSRSESESFTLYGYNASLKTNSNNTIDPQRSYSIYYEPGLSRRLATAPSLSGTINISQSYYTNVGYTYKDRYLFSASARRDESNLFGVESNQKGVPLWSGGLAWIVNKESFYRTSKWFPALKLRATFGYNGNVDKTVSGLLTVVQTGTLNQWNSPLARVTNPPNPELRWEKIQTWNFGIDFTAFTGRIDGSIDVYRKNAKDLIGNNPIAPQTGVNQFRGNGANLQTDGVELLLRSKNLRGPLEWNTTFIFNYSADKVTSYKIRQTTNQNIISGNFNNPLEGYPYYAIFSFPSAGLNATGQPQGYLDKVVSTNYGAIISKADPSQIKYHGSASPNYFGSLMNTFSFKGFELSANITYKFVYFFRRANVFNGFVSNYITDASGYKDRWQKPGDELVTRIPAFLYPANSTASNFFDLSEDLVEPADHIRLMDLRLSYRFSQKPKSVFRSPNVFLYGRNLGIIWKKTKTSVDPDYGEFTSPQPFSLSAGFTVNF
jgi:TonB-dependent starch-binding outer membrane protein SusC